MANITTAKFKQKANISVLTDISNYGHLCSSSIVGSVAMSGIGAIVEIDSSNSSFNLVFDEADTVAAAPRLFFV
ncbi:hypothetical protein PENSTE_c012G06422 [Penicillium steckii]|uniref:Uncharacterized protein n=1 Tax=Penicillium steckii TaxID=303698 RepID=A0A1V6T5B2_9EURO|nr:hypothetical protein PENSTE_c012G06422 [Penicillium steckii]